MRFKDYLIEQKKPLAGFLHNLNTMIDRELVLFRGQSTRGIENIGNIKATVHRSDKSDWSFNVDIFKVDVRTAPRRSRSGDDFFLDISSAWKDFPNRKFSTFTTQNGKFASDFGRFGIVIPADNVDLYGYSPTDFNDTKAKNKVSKFRKSTEEITAVITKIISYANGILDSNENQKVKDMLHDEVFKHDVAVEIQSRRHQFGDKLMDVAAFVDSLVDKSDKFAGIIKDTEDDYYCESFVDSLEELRKMGVKAADVFKQINPENYNLKSFKSLSEIPVKESSNEIWFVGSFLFIELPLDGNSFSKAYALDVLRSIKNEI